MNISVFGLGYVGAVTAGLLAKCGHSIVGVDVHAQKVDAFNNGIAPIIEPGLDDLFQSARQAGLLRATMDSAEAIRCSEVSIVCVGTPSATSGALDVRFVEQVVGQLGAALRTKRAQHAVILRSTMLPGTTGRLAAELSDLIDDGSLSIFFFPEFLREGSAIDDFEHPALAVVGTRDGTRPPAALMALFGQDAIVTNWQAAEMVKYACNAFHAAKVVFANEVGRIAKDGGIDGRAVMEWLCRDTKLNLSSYYLRPGNPFGGSCLPKDLRALTNYARGRGLHIPMLESLSLSNDRHLQSLLAMIEQTDHREIVILGLSFKTHTDDLRESSMVEVAQVLLGRGYRIRIFDPALNLSALVGANKRMIDLKMPHLASLLETDLAAAIGSRGLIVAAQRCASIADLDRVVTRSHEILDVNGWPELRALPSRYHGFCW
jgi:GDP-mannose 6-dehydrogenase